MRSDYCTNLTGVYFKGNAPSVGSACVHDDNNATVYYLPGTTGWGSTFGGRPTVLWNPQVQTSDASFGVRTNQFGFNITGTSNLVIVVEACTNLANPIWSPVGTNTLTGGSSYFSDPQWTNYPRPFLPPPLAVMVRARSTASFDWLPERSGTRWNASLPVRSRPRLLASLRYPGVVPMSSRARFRAADSTHSLPGRA